MPVEKVEYNDLPQILTLQKLCYQESGKRYNDFTIPPLVQTLEELEKEYASLLILKFCKDNKIVGSIRAFTNDDTCFIGRVIVHPDYQNRGIGKQLMLKTEEHFPDVRRYELFTGFRDEKNLYFYKSLGYIPFKEEKVTDNVILVYLEKKC